MYLPIFIIFVVICFILIGLGFYRPEHTELPLVGFFLLFMLSFLIINGSLEYKTGENITTQYNYNDILINYTTETRVDNYSTIEMEGALQHIIGYWMLVVSAVGFIGTLISLKRSRAGRWANLKG